MNYKAAFYAGAIFPPADDIVGCECLADEYQAYLEQNRALVLTGNPGCGLKSMAAYLGVRYQHQGVRALWLMLREAYREQAEDVLWQGGAFLTAQAQTEYQEFLQEDWQASRPYPMNMKFGYLVNELRLQNVFLVFNGLDVLRDNPQMLSMLLEMWEQFVYTPDTQARLVLTGTWLPLELQLEAVTLPGLDLEGVRQLLARFDVSLNDDALAALQAYTLGYPRYLTFYAEIAQRAHARGAACPPPETLAADLRVQAYVYWRYKLRQRTPQQRRLLDALAVVRQPIEHRTFRQQVLPDADPNDGQWLLDLIAEHSILVDATGDGISLHPVARDVLYRDLSIRDPQRARELEARVDTPTTS